MSLKMEMSLKVATFDRLWFPITVS